MPCVPTKDKHDPRGLSTLGEDTSNPCLSPEPPGASSPICEKWEAGAQLLEDHGFLGTTATSGWASWESRGRSQGPRCPCFLPQTLS